MEQNASSEVDHVFNAVTTVIGDTFSLDALVMFTELWRRKPLRIEADTMPVAMSGYCVALQDVDLICIREGMDSILSRSVQLHEIAHLLLGHLPPLSSGAATSSYSVFKQRRDLHTTLNRSYVDAYAELHERAAETLGTLLLECILREETAVPRYARNLYG